MKSPSPRLPLQYPKDTASPFPTHSQGITPGTLGPQDAPCQLALGTGQALGEVLWVGFKVPDECLPLQGKPGAGGLHGGQMGALL